MKRKLSSWPSDRVAAISVNLGPSECSKNPWIKWDCIMKQQIGMAQSEKPGWAIFYSYEVIGPP